MIVLCETKHTKRKYLKKYLLSTLKVNLTCQLIIKNHLLINNDTKIVHNKNFIFLHCNTNLGLCYLKIDLNYLIPLLIFFYTNNGIKIQIENTIRNYYFHFSVKRHICTFNKQISFRTIIFHLLQLLHIIKITRSS